MTLLLKQLFAFFKLLNSDKETNSIAWGLALGLFLGFAPILSLQGILVLFIIFFLRVQIGAAFLSAFFFKFVAFAFDPVSDVLGRWVLELPSLRSIFVVLYNAPIIPLTRFNNSIVMGSAVISLILVVPMFFLFRVLIDRYRVNVVQKFQQSKIWKFWSATAFYKWYTKYEELYG